MTYINRLYMADLRTTQAIWVRTRNAEEQYPDVEGPSGPSQDGD